MLLIEFFKLNLFQLSKILFDSQFALEQANSVIIKLAFI